MQSSGTLAPRALSRGILEALNDRDIAVDGPMRQSSVNYAW